MNSSSGLGQPSPGQPDFSRPEGDQPRSESNLSGWTHSGPGQPDGGPPSPGGPDPATPQLPAQFGSAPTPGIAPPGPGRAEQAGPFAAAQPSSGGGWTTSGPASYGQQPSGQPGAGPYGPTGYPPPAQRPPSRPPARRPSGRGFILAGAVIGLLTIGLLGWQFLAPRVLTQPSAGPSATATAAATPAGPPKPTVIRTSEAVQPTASTPVTGGGIGRAVDFKTTEGSARFTVTAADWADNGIFPPGEGSDYLVVNLTFEGVSGSVTTGPFFTRVTDGSGANHMITIGAMLERQLGMRTLTAGQQNTGQVAFEVPRGPLRFDVLNELLESVATIDIPA